MKKRSAFFDLLKGFAIWLVALGHVIQALNPAWKECKLDLAIIMFHMPLFMAVSGYFFYPSVVKNSFLAYTKKRFLRLYLPSLSWGVFSAILIGSGKFMNHKEIDILYFINLIFTGLWFLTVLFILSVLGALIHNYVHKGKIFVWIVLYVIIYFLPGLWMMNELKFLMPFFVGAIYLKRYDWENISWPVIMCAIVLFAVMLQIYTFDYSFYQMDYNPNTILYHVKSFVRLVCGASGIVGALWICRIFCRSSILIKVFSSIGIVTLPIYALHQKFLLPFRFLPYRSDNVCLAMAVSVVVIIASIITYRIVKKNDILNFFLFGGGKQ